LININNPERHLKNFNIILSMDIAGIAATLDGFDYLELGLGQLFFSLERWVKFRI